MFEIEQHCKEMKPEERYKYRQEQAKPIVDAFLNGLKHLWSQEVVRCQKQRHMQ